MDLDPLIQRAAALVDAARKAGADACDAVVASSRSSGVEVRKGAVEETESAENNAFTLRVFLGKRAASISANRIEDAAELAARAISMARVALEDPDGGLADQSQLAESYPDLELFDDTELSFDGMRERALQCEEAALGVEGITKSSGASCGHSLGATVLVTSHGFSGSYRASRFSVSASVVGGQGGGMERDYDYDSQRFLADLRDAADIGKEAGRRAVARLDPVQMDTGAYTVVYEPRMARGLVGHLAGALNGSSIARKTSFLRDDMEERVFRNGVSIIDEPHLKRGVASRPFDAEGLLPDALELVSDGALQNWLLDCSTARKLDLASNARANRAGSGTSPGSTNLTLQAGTIAPDELIAGVKDGLYVTELIGQGVSLVTGDYSRGASGFRIRDGKLAEPVSEITVAGNLRDMFSRLVAANDVEKRFGTNAPTVAIEGLTIAGK